MTKQETPPFRMRIESGHLVPVSAWDQERLATYRNKSELTVQITQQKNRKLERKYWAILHEVIKSCPVKQRTAEDLHKAIRLKLGVVDAYFTVEGKLRVDVKSTTGMDDPEYGQFYEDAMGLLHDITGVDPEQLGAESPDVGEDPETSAALPADAGGEVDCPDNLTSDPEPDEVSESSLDTSSGSTIQDESDHEFDEKEWLKTFAKVIVAAIGPDETVVVDASKGQFVENLSEDTSSRARTIVQYARQACRGEIEPDDAKEIIAGKARMESVKDLV